MVAIVQVDNLNQTVRDLQRLGLEVDDLKDAFSTIANEAAAVIEAAAPKRTGRLAGDIKGNRAKAKAVVSVGRSKVPYAGPINYGWPSRGIDASNFMQAADDGYAHRAVARLEQEINEQIRKKGLV